MPLADTRVRNAKPQEKPYKLADDGGLYVEVKPTGAKLWRYRYRIAGKENVFAIGKYPAVTLAEARSTRDDARKLVKQGIHPAHQRKLERLRRVAEHADTFEAIAREWLTHNAARWTARSRLQRQRLLERDVFPWIGSMPVRQVLAAHILQVLRKTELRAPAMAVLARQCIGAIFGYAVSTLRAEIDPTITLRGALRPRTTEHKRPFTRADIPTFFSALEDYPGTFPNKVAIRLAWLTLARSVEVLTAKWNEFDLEHALWRIPAERMKMREPHTIPLSRQAVELLQRLHGVTVSSEYLFPCRTNWHKPVSPGVIRKAFDSMGYAERFTPHAIRVTGSTILNEMGFPADWIERQLAHQERNKVRASYNRAEYLAERREMMQVWADLLDGNVIAGRFGKAA
jgi:integrase